MKKQTDTHTQQKRESLEERKIKEVKAKKKQTVTHFQPSFKMEIGEKEQLSFFDQAE